MLEIVRLSSVSITIFSQSGNLCRNWEANFSAQRNQNTKFEEWMDYEKLSPCISGRFGTYNQLTICCHIQVYDYTQDRTSSGKET